ncbi:MAG TPA: hypothetical protein VMH05_09285 [Bryobacteraceae bacterium]|nr:hypothetical protein [Bryobacteraceae bacterium]
MPIMSALPLGLPLYGTTSVQFGDGKTATRFTALGVAELGNESEAGVVILEPSTSTILVGMEFLSAFKKTVFLHRGVLVLLDQSEMDKTLPPDVVEAIRQMASPVEAPTKPKEEPPPAKAPPPTQN